MGAGCDLTGDGSAYAKCARRSPPKAGKGCVQCMYAYGVQGKYSLWLSAVWGQQVDVMCGLDRLLFVSPNSLRIRRIHLHVMGCEVGIQFQEKWVVRRQGQIIEVSR